MKKLFNFLVIFVSITAVNLFSMDYPEGIMSVEHEEQVEQERVNREIRRLDEELRQQRLARQQEARRAREARGRQGRDARRRLNY